MANPARGPDAHASWMSTGKNSSGRLRPAWWGVGRTDASADEAAALVLHMQIFWPGKRGFCLKAGAWQMAMCAQPVL